MLRISVKYLDGRWRLTCYNMRSKEAEIKYGKELVEMLKHFMCKGNILGYTVAIVTYSENDQHIEVIGTEV